MTEEVFEQAARTYGDAIFRVAYHAVKDRGEAEDVTQTVLLRLYLHKDAFESEDHLKHWLLRVTVNESRKILRSAWRRRTVPLEGWDGPTEDRREEQEVLDAVMSLETKYEGCSVKEIAQILRSNPSTIQTRMQRAREKLKIALADDEKEGNGCVRSQIIS